MHTNIPGIEFDLLNGFQKLSKMNKNFGYYDEDLGFSTIEKIPQELRNQWNRFLQMGSCN
jgi:hypothetical protein